ncbi:hypothetical protein C0992_008756 [Termitomyces sp. T32_za158]|nr:hypothetical protein C0992_008756 [Termitomyces sp. T32_za158]
MLRSTILTKCSRAPHNIPFFFHTSATVSAKKAKSSSRKRLSKDLQGKPGIQASNLKIAPSLNEVEGKQTSKHIKHTFTRGGKKTTRVPPRREFPRDPLPHEGLEPNVRQDIHGRKISFRRDRRNNRNGRWEGESRDEFEEWELIHQTNSKMDRRWRNPGKASAFGALTRSSILQGQKDLGQARNRQQTESESLRRITEMFTKAQERSLTTQDLSDLNVSQANPTGLATRFTSPPLMPGLLSCLREVLGPKSFPTPIQALSLKWLLDNPSETDAVSDGWKQFLLASETGSGKSIAYLLPVLQNLKLSELNPSSPHSRRASQGHQRPLNPRALILAPTHELSRQLSSFAKSLLHEVKLRVLCASRANVKSTKERDATARQMATQLEADEESGEFEIKERSGFPVDVVVGTPMKLLEMVKGRGWDRKEPDAEDGADTVDDEFSPKPRRGRDKLVGFGKWRNKPEMGLANVEWVVVDEADVLFDPDFQETTRQLLADISAARGHPIPLVPASSVNPSDTPLPSTPMPYDYPFNLILASATIPASLAAYLDTHHPKMMRLASPRLHHLPKTLQTEYVNWSGGNKHADIERRIRHVWAEDSFKLKVDDSPQQLSKILIFCNKSTKVKDLGDFLVEQGIENIALSSTSEHRKRGSNHHLDGFLRIRDKDSSDSKTEQEPATLDTVVASDPKINPHVLITTSLLSRGLDFSPSIQHVFCVDQPRNMIDFLHRAGRTGRAGEKGKVVIFGKMKGRGSSSAKDVRKKVGSLAAH